LERTTRLVAIPASTSVRIVMVRKTASRGQDENASCGEPTQRQHMEALT
jgi:hypothetical protein